ncbi:MAG: hypothetical protein H6538_03090 [Bacteroidales bacterium]|nr:hypothetical protein [Bacteroidales bacterium]MCB9013375.1 hypothetical protein [Bacteroidales bacterium]
MGPSLFWGLLLVILGLSLIFKIVFGIDFHFFRVFIAFLLIFFGIKMLIGHTGTRHFETKENDVVFGEKHYSNPDNDRDYNVVFGKGVFDLRGYDLKGERQRLKISTVFGASIIKLDKELPVRIKVESAFAGTDLPNGNSAVFGSTSYESPGFDDSKPFLDLRIDAVFAGCEVRTY